MALRRETIGAQIKRILRLRPNRDEATGMLYKTRRELVTKRKKVTLAGLFVSDENTFLIRPHLFNSKTGRNAVEWERWFSVHYGDILPTILEGMEGRTGKQWRLYRILGWLPDDNTRIIRTKTHTKRNKNKQKRRKNGRSRTRSR